MSEICLVVRVSAYRKRDAEKLLGVISDYADEQFEAYTMEHGRPMNMVSWTEPADQQQRLHLALAGILDWFDGLPNDMFDGEPLSIKKARKLIPEPEKV